MNTPLLVSTEWLAGRLGDPGIRIADVRWSLLEKDKGRRSSCSGQCAKFWPPLLTSGKPTAGAGAKASLLGTTRRSNGTMQVTYAGHPLYRFTQDKKSGQTRGEGLNFFGASWYVLSPSGKKIDKD